MAAWVSALKAVLPYVTDIVTAAIPAFTARKDRSAEVTAQQIAGVAAYVVTSTGGTAP